MNSEAEHSVAVSDRSRRRDDSVDVVSRGDPAQPAVGSLPIVQENLPASAPRGLSAESKRSSSCDGNSLAGKGHGQNESGNAEAENQKLESRVRQIKHKLLVLSGKGGVGKSTIAANLAVSLAQQKHKVGLLDIDVHGPSIPKMLGLENRQIDGSEDGMLPVQMNENLTVMSIGFMLPRSGDPVIWRGPLKYGVIRQFLMDVAWGPLDYLVVDSPPGTGDEPLSIAQLVGSDSGAVIVTTPQDVAIADVRRCISFCNKLSLPVVGLIENMSSYVCPKCGDRASLFGSGGGRILAEEMNIPFLGEIPIDPKILVSGDTGKPFTAEYAATPGAIAFASVASRILELQYAVTQ